MNLAINQVDWQKHAAAAVQSDEDVEKAFLDQAYLHVQNKATPLMKSPFRVGFEIVHKNDENTRMVGIFVFRINQHYLFVPVFFVNGSIKGTDLLYREDVKRFVPLNNEWCTYLIQLNVMDEGKGISQRERQFTRDQMNLTDLVEPPEVFRFHRKYASVCDSNEELTYLKAATAKMLEKLASISDPDHDSVLRRFIINHGGFNSIKKLANTAKHDFDFAKALMLASHPDNYMPKLDPYPKQAAAEHLVVVHSSVLKNKNVKSASAREMCQGYKIDDYRKEAMANDVVYVDNTAQISMVEAPGVYDILLADGTNRKMLVGYYLNMNTTCGDSPPATISSYDPGSIDKRRRDLVLIDTENRHSKTIYVTDQQWPFGDYDGKIEDGSMLQDMSEADAGTAYRIYDTEAQSFSEPFYVARKEKDPSGLTALYCVNYNTGDAPNRPLLVNPDIRDYDPKDNIFGTKCKLVRIAHRLEDGYNKDMGKRVYFEDQLGIGGKHTLNAFIFENNFKKASVMAMPNDKYLVKTARTKDKWTQELSKMSAKIRLMLDCALREETADEVIKLADVKSGKVEDDDLVLAEVARERASKNWLKPVHVKRQDVGLEEWEAAKKQLRVKRASQGQARYDFVYDGTKLAHNLRFNDWPDFYERSNDEFGVLEQPWTNYILDTESDKPIIEQHRIGDRWSQDDSGAIDTMNPMQLYDLSKNKGMGNLFEHGVVGELVKTYDAAGLVQTYIPDMEKALDRVGRIIFLFYWKPEDFAQAYGSDDQTDMENKLLSNFKSLGEMVLDLLQRAKLSQEGSASLT